MKPFTFYALILSLFSSFFSFSQDFDSTLLEKIKTHDTVYVFIEHGQIKSEQYNSTYGKIGLNANEIKMEAIQATFPSEIDSLSDSLLIDLNKQFKPLTTTTFVYIGSGSNDDLIKLFKAKQLDMIFVFSFTGSYGYYYLQPCTRAIPEKITSEFISYRRCSVNSILKIYQFDDKNKFDDALMAYNLSHGEPYKEVGYTNNANVHLKEFNPMQLKTSIVKGSISSTERIIEKLNNEQEKADKKRAKKSK